MARLENGSILRIGRRDDPASDGSKLYSTYQLHETPSSQMKQFPMEDVSLQTLREGFQSIGWGLRERTGGI